MKIVYVYYSLAAKAGTERVLINQMNFFADNFGYDIYVITSGQGQHPVAYPLSSKVKQIDLNTRFHTEYQHKMPIRSYVHQQIQRKHNEKLQETIRSLNPDIIMTTTYSYESISTISKLSDKYIKIIQSHVYHSFLGYENKQKRDNILYNLYTKYTQRRFQKAISKYDTLVTLTQRDAVTWSDVKTAVIPNSLTLHPQQFSSCDTKNVITAGRLEIQKGYDLLIEAWNIVINKHPDWKLNLYGTGSQKENLTSLIYRYNLRDSFIINDPVENIYDKYLQSSFYVLSSRWEGFALVLLEAMSCGVPCISFDCPCGPDEIIKNNENGIIVENGNVEDLAERICFLIEHENIRKQMGTKAKESLKEYLPETIFNQWKILLESLLKEKNKR